MTRERYELAQEADPKLAERMRVKALACPRCQAALDEPPLGSALAAWAVPAEITKPIDWRSALRTAIAPAAQPVAPPRRARWRMPGLALVAALLLIAATIPAAAAAGPGSILYPVRGLEENARFGLTSTSERPKLEADLASAYLQQAKQSADRNDRSGYQQSMDRFFEWAQRLKADVRNSPKSERGQIRATVTADKTLLPSLAGSQVDQSQAGHADSILTDVEGESQENNSGQQGDN